MIHDLTDTIRILTIDCQRYRTLRIQTRYGNGIPSTAVVEAKRAMSPSHGDPALSFDTPVTIALDESVTLIDVTDEAYVALEVTTAEAGISVQIDHGLAEPIRGQVIEAGYSCANARIAPVMIDTREAGKGFVLHRPAEALTTAQVVYKQSEEPGGDKPRDTLLSGSGATLDGSGIDSLDLTEAGYLHFEVTNGQNPSRFDVWIYLRERVHLTEDDSSGGGASALDDLTDVTLTSPASGDALSYNGSVWINKDNPAFTDEVQTFSVVQTFANLRVEGSGIGYSRIDSDATAGTTVTLPNQTGDIPIVITASPSNGNTLVRSGSGYVARDLVWSDISSLYAGSSFPGSPEDGQPYYRTDLDMPELFHYDNGRSKWLGELRRWQWGRDSSASSGSLVLMTTGDVQGTSARGVLTPHPLTVVGIEYFNGGSFSGTADLDLYEGSTKLTTLLSITARGNSDFTLDYDIDADAGWPQKWLRINNVTGGTITNPTIMVYLRRRES